MGQDLSLRVMLRAVDSGASSMVQGLGRAIGGLSGPAGIAVSALADMGSALLDVAAQATQAAANWQTSLNSLVTGAGESQSNLAMVSAGMLKMAVDTGTSTSQLAAGMYMIESGGYHGAQGLDILKAAAEGAKVGAADLGVVADATDTVLKNFGETGLTATQAVNTLIATVSHGKTTMQGLSSALSGILPVASSVGVSLNDTAGAMSTMTGEGVPAAQAATFLRQMLLALNAPTVAATRQLKDVGLTTQQVSSAMKKSLPGALQMITTAVGKKFPVGSAQYIAALKNIMGGSKNLQGMLDLTGQHLKTFKDNTHAIADAVKKGGNSVNGWSLVQGSFNQKMAQAKEAVETLFIKIGQHLLPVMTKIVGNITPAIQRFSDWLIKSGALQNGLKLLGDGVKGLAGFIGGLITGIGNVISFFQKNQAAAAALLIPLGALGAYLAMTAFWAVVLASTAIPGLVAGFIAWATTAWAAAAGTIAATWPILLIGAAIGALIAIIILLVTHWSQVVAFLKNVWGAVSSWVINQLKLQAQIWSMVWQKIVDGLKAAWNWIVSVVQAGLSFLVGIFTAPFRAIGMLFQWLYAHNKYFALMINVIRQAVTNGLNWLHDRWQQAITWLAGLWNGLKDKASQAWNNVKQAVINAVLALGEWEIAQWNKATKWLSDKWNSYKDLMGKAWQMVSGLLSGVWNTYVSKPLQNLWNSIVNFVNGWPKQFFQSGINMIQGLINGMLSMIGKAGQAASNIMKNIAQFLGFHSPAAQGEGRYIIQWGNNMVKGFSSGVLEAIPALQASVALAVKQGTSPMSGSPALVSVPYGRPPSGNSYSSYAGGNNYHYGDIVIHGANQNPDAIAKAVEDRLNRKYRRSFQAGNTAGGLRNS